MITRAEIGKRKNEHIWSVEGYHIRHKRSVLNVLA